VTDTDHLLPEGLQFGGELPPDLDPLAEGILMKHQREWLEDDSDLKLGEKGRRTGITFAEALDDALLAAKARSAGGMNVFYIGDTKDKGREFVAYVAHFARIVGGELVSIEEYMFEDQQADGSTRLISAFRVQFASGFRVEALSSRPENIRGLQGKVVIDEAAFHKNVREVLDAVNALLIWGGKIVVISTHNGVLSPFNELILEAKAGKVPFKLHFIPFQKAVDNGLYRRVCLKLRKDWTKDGEIEWERQIRASYGVRTSAMHQELDCLPAESEGAALTRVQIESCMAADIPIVRWVLPDSFKNEPEEARKAAAKDFCDRELLPILEKLDPNLRHVFGEDFARTGDAADTLVLEIGSDLTRRAVLLLELRNVPFDQQRDVLFYVIDRLPRRGGRLDATGNGAYIAEAAALRYGACVVEVKLSAEWYRLNSPPYIEAFSDRTVLLPKHDDVLRDHQALAYVGGVIKVPDDYRFKGTDGFPRHGDSAIAGILAYAASRADYWEAGYRSPSTDAARDDGPSDDDETRDWWRQPLGAGLRGGA